MWVCFRAGLGKTAYLSSSDDTDPSHGVACLELLDLDAARHNVKQAARAAKWLARLVPPLVP